MRRISENFPRSTCAFHFFSAWLIAISYSCALSSLLFPPVGPFPRPFFDAFPRNLSLPELISQPLSVFQVSVSHLHHARLDLSPQPAGGPAVSAAWNQTLLFWLFLRFFFFPRRSLFYFTLFFFSFGIPCAIPLPPPRPVAAVATLRG